MAGGSARTLFITGAASGIGAALARRLAAPGVALALHTRANRVGLEATAAAARAGGAEAATLTGDFAEPGTPAALVAATRARFGRIDALIANAVSSFVAHVFRPGVPVFPAFIRKDAGTRAAVDPARLNAQIPLGRLGRPEEVAAAIAFLLAPEPTGLTGALLAVDGGLML